MRHAFSIFGVVSLLLAACACGLAASGDKPRATVPHTYYSSASVVCKLLAERELEAVLGRNFYVQERGFGAHLVDFPGITTCVYPTKEQSVLYVQTGVVYAYGEAIFHDVERTRREGRPMPLKKVQGLGERAFWDPGVSELVVLSQGTIFAIFVQGELFDQPKDTELRARRLAAIALLRLK